MGQGKEARCSACRGQGMSGVQLERPGEGLPAVSGALREALRVLLYDHVDPRSVWGGMLYWRCRGCDAHAGATEGVLHEPGCPVHALCASEVGA